MRRIFRWRVLGATLIALTLVAAACGDDDSGGDARSETTITVSSFNFGESEILAEIYAQVLEGDGYTVARKLNLGNREIVKPALEAGEIDFVPEYVGAALTFFDQEPTADSAATHAALSTAFAEVGVAVLEFSEAQDVNSIVVTSQLAADLGLSSIGDLAAHNGTLIFGAPPECPGRDACLIGLSGIYGIEFAEFKPLDAGGPLTREALSSGQIDVALLFSTDAAIATNGWVVLDDDMGLESAQNIVPVVRQAIVDALGDDFVSLINSVSSKIDTAGLTELNRQQSVDGRDPAEIAKDWLAANGF